MYMYQGNCTTLIHELMYYVIVCQTSYVYSLLTRANKLETAHTPGIVSLYGPTMNGVTTYNIQEQEPQISRCSACVYTSTLVDTQSVYTTYAEFPTTHILWWALLTNTQSVWDTHCLLGHAQPYGYTMHTVCTHTHCTHHIVRTHTRVHM